MAKRQTRLIHYRRFMEDERRHNLEKREWIRQALRDWFLRGKIEVKQQTDEELDAATRPSQVDGQPVGTMGGPTKINRTFDFISWIWKF